MEETITRTDFEGFLKQREKAKTMQRKWELKVQELTSLINKICVHSKTETATEFVEGSYYDRAEYHTIKRCLICKKELDRKTELGGYG